VLGVYENEILEHIVLHKILERPIKIEENDVKISLYKQTVSNVARPLSKLALTASYLDFLAS
jgi:hypothetical protein